MGTRPNAVLTEVATDLAPGAGTALDLACGHGGDALWLASLGWRVLAVDVSATVLARVDAAAGTAGVADRMTTARHDLSRSFPPGRFDLVSAFSFHTPIDIPRDQVLRRQRGGPGGLLLVVDHASVTPWSRNADERQHERFPAPEETLDTLRLDLGGWQVERLAAPQQPAVGPQGQSATVTENVIALRRGRG